ncbi:MAG: BrnA antitoxin family protein [Planktomarina sp.]
MTTKPDTISQEDWDAVDVPELTDAQFAKARPFAEHHPDLAEKAARGRGAQKSPTKVRVGMRLDADVLTALRESGKGWQTRANALLRDGLGL